MSMATPAPAQIRVQTPCRLHLGIFNLPDEGYGGIGVAIDRPNVSLSVMRSDRLTASGPQADRALKAAEALQRAFGVQDGAEIHVSTAITPHVGLGSGTQIALAAAATLARLWRLNASVQEIAGLAGRAARSRIGLQAFIRGGFVAHATWRSGETETRHRRFPPGWRWVVVAPPETEGLSGEAEAHAFAELPPMDSIARHAARDLVELDILPGVDGADIHRFGRGLLALQEIVGDYFAPVQGGRYAHPLGERVVDALVEAGAAGAGQSSWGPSLCGVVSGEAEAQRVCAAILRRFAESGLQAWVAAPDNHGTRWDHG